MLYGGLMTREVNGISPSFHLVLLMTHQFLPQAPGWFPNFLSAPGCFRSDFSRTSVCPFWTAPYPTEQCILPCGSMCPQLPVFHLRPPHSLPPSLAPSLARSLSVYLAARSQLITFLALSQTVLEEGCFCPLTINCPTPKSVSVTNSSSFHQVLMCRIFPCLPEDTGKRYVLHLCVRGTDTDESYPPFFSVLP